MRTQIAAKFLAADIPDTKQRLDNRMATLLTPMRVVRIAVVDYPDRTLQKNENSSIIVRDEGTKATMSYCQTAEQRQGGTKQTDLVIDSFDVAIELLEEIGMSVQSLQESRQEVWQMGTVDIVLEEWPWVKPFIEIIGPSEAAIRDVSARVGLAWSQAVFGSTTIAYASEYPGIRLDRGEDITHLDQIKFGASLPAWLKERQAS